MVKGNTTNERRQSYRERRAKSNVGRLKANDGRKGRHKTDWFFSWNVWIASYTHEAFVLLSICNVQTNRDRIPPGLITSSRIYYTHWLTLSLCVCVCVHAPMSLCTHRPKTITFILLSSSSPLSKLSSVCRARRQISASTCVCLFDQKDLDSAKKIHEQTCHVYIKENFFSSVNRWGASLYNNRVLPSL